MFPSSFAHGNFSSRYIALLSTPLAIIFMFMMSAAHAQAAVNTSALVELTNQDRTAQGLGPVRQNALLDQAAQLKASDMAAKGYFAHNSPDGKTSWTWFQMAGYRYLRAGENLAEGFPDAQTVETAWLNSPSHRANIMNGTYTEVGFGTATGMYQGHEVIFVAEMFGTPQGSNTVLFATASMVPASTVSSAAASAPASRKVLGAKASTTTASVAKQPRPLKKVTQASIPAPVPAAISPIPSATRTAPAVPEHPWQRRLLSFLSTGYARLLAFATGRPFA